MPKRSVGLLQSHRWLFACVVAIFPFFFMGGPSWQSARSLGEIWNLGHVLFFFLFTLLAWGYPALANFAGWLRLLIILFTVLLIGLGIEGMQLFVGNRSVGWDDIARNLAGAALALIWIVDREVHGYRWRKSLRLVAAVIGCGCLLPIGIVLVDEYRARRDFPLLASFESRLELERWSSGNHLDLVSDPVREGHFAVAIHLRHEEYSGAALVHFPGDWRGYDALAFSMFNPGEPVELHFRVHDREHAGDRQQYHDRYNGTRMLAGGWNDILIPMSGILSAPQGRTMDLAHIRGFGLFLMDQPARLLYLDNVRLVESNLE
jgi:VanZ family protein